MTEKHKRQHRAKNRRAGDIFKLRYPRERCWQITLEFGPHSFTLLEYSKREPAVDSLESILTNWREHLGLGASERTP